MLFCSLVCGGLSGENCAPPPERSPERSPEVVVAKEEMSIALEMGGAGFICGIGCVPIYDSPEIGKDPPESSSSSASSSSSSYSSIGKDSDDVGGKLEDDEGTGMGEVQSAYKGLLQGMESMEESLPIRRGISNFYAGKAKSFTSLSDAVASCASGKDLAKAENAYTRRRRNLLASKIIWEKPHSNLLRTPVGGIAKRPAAPVRSSTLALAVAMSSSPRTYNIGEYEEDNHQFLPPLQPPEKPTVVVAEPVDCSSSLLCSFPMRSFSLGDLPVLKKPGSSIGPSGEQ